MPWSAVRIHGVVGVGCHHSPDTSTLTGLAGRLNSGGRSAAFGIRPDRIAAARVAACQPGAAELVRWREAIGCRRRLSGTGDRSLEDDRDQPLV